MENINEVMNLFKEQLKVGNIQKAYRHIFELFADISKELKSNEDKDTYIGSPYHGYMDMTYIPISTNILKNNGLKVAIVFNYESFQFELWLSSVNRKKRTEVLELISKNKWEKYKTVQNDENKDAIIEIKIKGIDEYSNKNKIVTLVIEEVLNFIKDVEEFLVRNE